MLCVKDNANDYVYDIYYPKDDGDGWDKELIDMLRQMDPKAFRQTTEIDDSDEGERVRCKLKFYHFLQDTMYYLSCGSKSIRCLG